MYSAQQSSTASAGSQSGGANSRKADANRANAQHSNGPASEAGKAASSQNATRHSMLTSTATLLAKPNEELQKLIAVYRTKFKPADVHEDFLVSEVAVADWRTKHLARIEQGVMTYMMASTHSTIVAQDQADGLSQDDPSLAEAGDEMHTLMMGCAWVNNPKAFALLHRYQTQARRDYYKALKQLELVRTGKAGYLPKEQPAEAQQAPTAEKSGTNPPTRQTAPAAPPNSPTEPRQAPQPDASRTSGNPVSQKNTTDSR